MALDLIFKIQLFNIVYNTLLQTSMTWLHSSVICVTPAIVKQTKKRGIKRLVWSPCRQRILWFEPCTYCCWIHRRSPLTFQYRVSYPQLDEINWQWNKPLARTTNWNFVSSLTFALQHRLKVPLNVHEMSRGAPLAYMASTNNWRQLGTI